MKQIVEALESFFKKCDCDVVETMESMLYDWYQHYALEHYHQDHVTAVVNEAFRVNDLLLKLREAICVHHSGQVTHNAVFPQDFSGRPASFAS